LETRAPFRLTPRWTRPSKAEEAEEAGLPNCIVGHVGEGDFHIAYLIDPTKPVQRDTALRLNA